MQEAVQINQYVGYSSNQWKNNTFFKADKNKRIAENFASEWLDEYLKKKKPILN